METITRTRNSPRRIMSGFLGQDPLEDYTYDETGLNDPAINIAENNEQWNIEVGAPGLCSDNYEINVHDDVLLIEASKQMNTPDRNYSHQEFRFNNFRRSFTLPKSADISRISASCNDGMLDITIPKKEQDNVKGPKKINIE